MSAETLRTKGLTKVYRTGAAEVTALRGVDFEARAGEFIVMLGPSGSGKSTFLNIVGRLDRATSDEAPPFSFPDGNFAQAAHHHPDKIPRDHLISDNAARGAEL